MSGFKFIDANKKPQKSILCSFEIKNVRKAALEHEAIILATMFDSRNGAPENSENYPAFVVFLISKVPFDFAVRNCFSFRIGFSDQLVENNHRHHNFCEPEHH